MGPFKKPFAALTAHDVMTPTVLALPREMSLTTAARLLRGQHVSGAPVVDGQGRCIGVLSTTDYLRWAENVPAGRGIERTCASPIKAWEMAEEDERNNEEVHQFMTSDVVSVPPSTGLVALARKMLDAHIHRIIVVDEDGRPIGVVSTTDILSAIAQGEVSNN